MARRTSRAIHGVLVRQRPILRDAVCPTLARVFVNRFLKKPLGPCLEGLTVENLEAVCLADLADSGHFARLSFPVLGLFESTRNGALLNTISHYKARFEDFEDPSRNDVGYTFKNDYFGSPDAEVLYAIVREFRPSSVVIVFLYLTAIPELSPGVLIHIHHDVDGVLAGVEPYDCELLAALPHLRCTSRCGVGTDAIDLNAAHCLNIAVLTTSEEVVEPVAQMTVAMIFALARNFPLHYSDFRTGQWRKRTGYRLSEWTIGLVGFGGIDRAVERYLQAFALRLIVADPHMEPSEMPDGVKLLGSAALSLAYVAASRVDAYYERDIRLWDVAGGLAIVRAAGGVVVRAASSIAGTVTVYAGNSLPPWSDPE